MRYWKATKQTAQKITLIVEDWENVSKSAIRLAKKVGATSRFYKAVCFGGLRIVAFIFKDSSKVDKSKWCAVKGTADGWRPRAKTEAADEFGKLQSYFLADVMKQIGMPMLSGVSVRHPGLRFVGSDVYLTTPDDVEAKGCKRISDLEYEKTVATKRLA